MKIYIETLGCPKNFSDTEKAMHFIEKSRHEVTEDLESSDAVMVNTCGFINDAKVESIETIFDVAKMGKKIIVSGCLSKRYGEELFNELKEAQVIIGVNEYEKMGSILDRLEEGEDRILDISTGETPIRYIERSKENLGQSGTIKIGEGCSNRCTYCVIPDIRGNYRSKPLEDIVREAEELCSCGVKEIVLIAQDTTAYGMDIYGGLHLHKLIKELVKVEGLTWLRLMYCYEDRITDELIETMAKEAKVCKYLDMPIQHGSNRILKLMGRRTNRELIRNNVKKLRDAMPDIVLRTSIIVGFPGETDEDFQELMDFIEEIKFDRLGVFTYSQEEGTPAAEMADQIDEEVKKKRRDLIMLKQMDISLEKNQDLVGKIMDVLVEEMEPEFVGRTAYDAAEIDNRVLLNIDEGDLRECQVGDIVKTKIIQASEYELGGVII